MTVNIGVLTSAPGGQQKQLQSDKDGNLKVTGTTNLFTNNQTSVTTTAAALSAVSINATFGVIVKALNANTAAIYIGTSSSVTSATGYELGAGENISIPVNNANLLWVISASGTQTVCWIAI